MQYAPTKGIKAHMKNRLFYKIFGTYLVIIVLSMAIVGFLVCKEVKNKLMEKIEYDLITYARMINLTSPKKEIEKRKDEISDNEGAKRKIAKEKFEIKEKTVKNAKKALSKAKDELKTAKNELKSAEKLAAKRKRRLVKPPISSRYDDVYFEGLEWLDSLAGAKMPEGEKEAVFSDSIWKSPARAGDDFSY